MLGEQVERLLDTVAEERVLILQFDEFHRSTREIYLRVENFLGLSDDGRTEFPRVNGNRRHSNPWLSRLLMHPPFPFNHVKSVAKEYMRLRDTRLMTWIYEKMQLKENRASLPDEFARVLRDHFEADQQKLRRLLRPALLKCA